MLSDKEAKTLEAIINRKSVKAAAEKLGVASNSVSQRLLRMKLKEVRYERWLDSYRRYKMRMPVKYME